MYSGPLEGWGKQWLAGKLKIYWNIIGVLYPYIHIPKILVELIQFIKSLNYNNLKVKPGEWNRYEILAVGDRIWTAINGKLCVAIKDPEGERSGKIAFKIHGGPPQTVRYRSPVLTHNPKVTLAGLSEQELNARLNEPLDLKEKASR